MASDPLPSDQISPDDSRPRIYSWWSRLAEWNPTLLTVAALALATGLRMALTPLWGSGYTFIAYYPAIMFIAVANGWRHGIGATLISAALSAGLFLDMESSPRERGMALAVFIAANVVIVSLSEAVTRARLRAQEEASLVRAKEHQLRREIEARTRTEETVRASQRQMQFVTDHAPVLIAQCGTDGRYRFVNQQYAALLGRTPEDLIGRHPGDVLGAEVYKQAAPFMRKALAGQRVKFDQQFLGATSVGRLLQVAYAPEFDERGTVTGFIAAIADITERRQAEQARATLAAIVESSGDAIISKDLTGVITSWNLGAERLFGYTRQEAVGQPVTLLIPEGWLDEEAPILTRIRRGEAIQQYETVRRRKDGTLIHISLTLSAIRNDEGRIVGVSKVAHDITERKRAEEALRESEAQQRATFDNAAVGIAHVGLDGRWLRCNDAMCALTGYSREELLTKTFTEITHPDDIEPDWSAVRRLLAGEIETYSIEKRYIRKDGSLIWGHLTVSLLRDAQGRPQHFISIVQDIQSRKEAQAQLRQLADDLERRVEERTRELADSQDKLRALTTDLNLTEHRIRQQLATDLHDYLAQLLVLSRLKLGQAKLDDVTPSAAQAMTEVQEVMDQALSYTRTLVAQLSPPILNEFGLLMALRWMADQMQRELTVTFDVKAETLPLSEQQSVLLFQSVRELLMNIVKHAGTTEAWIAVARSDETLRITVSDRGAGCDLVAAETSLEQGFGLFSIRERMKALGGGFEVESAPGQGTTATLWLPLDQTGMPDAQQAGEPGLVPEVGVVAPESATPGLPHPPMSTPFRHAPKIRVLLVDDHQMLRQGLRAIVNEHPRMEVVGEAGEGWEAIELARTLKPDVVVMDINMPRCDGLTATQRIKEEYPEMKIVGLSMHNSPDMMERMKQAGASGYVTKESAGKQLCRAIVQAAMNGS